MERKGERPRRVAVLMPALTLVLVLVTVAVAGCGAADFVAKLNPFDGKGDTTTSTPAVSASTSTSAVATSSTGTSGGGATTTRRGGTLTSARAGFASPEAAVQAVVQPGWVVQLAWEADGKAEVWAGPPNSEFERGFSCVEAAGAWSVVSEWVLGGPGETPGGGTSSGGTTRTTRRGATTTTGSSTGDGQLVGGPWYEADYPEIWEAGSGLGKPFREDAYPWPSQPGYPGTGAAQAVWNATGEMLNLLKEKQLTDATWYVTEDFYRNFFFDFFNPGEPVDFYEFELTGWKDRGDGSYAIWADLYDRDAVSSSLRRAIFRGSPAGGGGILWDVDIWAPEDL
jgi:hypothetical protein